MPPPVASFSAGDTAFCSNNCISFTNLSANATSWKWVFEGGNPSSDVSENPQNICYQSPGSYDVTLIAYNPGGSDSVTFSNYIHVKPVPPTPFIVQEGNLLSCSTDPDYVSYQWYDSTALIPGATDSLLIISHDGNYNVQVTNAEGCTTGVGISVVTGVTASVDNRGFIIVPNPFTSSAALRFGSQLQDAELAIYDMIGKEVLRRKINGSRIEIEKGSLGRGIYFVSVRSSEKKYLQKIVID